MKLLLVALCAALALAQDAPTVAPLVPLVDPTSVSPTPTFNFHENVVPKDPSFCHFWVMDDDLWRFLKEQVLKDDGEGPVEMGSHRLLRARSGRMFYWVVEGKPVEGKPFLTETAEQFPRLIDVITRPGTTWEQGVTLTPGKDQKAGFHCAGGKLSAAGFTTEVDGDERLPFNVEDIIYIERTPQPDQEYETPVLPTEPVKEPFYRFYHLDQAFLTQFSQFCSRQGVCSFPETQETPIRFTFTPPTPTPRFDFYHARAALETPTTTDLTTFFSFFQPLVTPAGYEFTFDRDNRMVTVNGTPFLRWVFPFTETLPPSSGVQTPVVPPTSTP